MEGEKRQGQSIPEDGVVDPDRALIERLSVFDVSQIGMLALCQLMRLMGFSLDMNKVFLLTQIS